MSIAELQAKYEELYDETLRRLRRRYVTAQALAVAFVLLPFVGIIPSVLGWTVQARLAVLGILAVVEVGIASTIHRERLHGYVSAAHRTRGEVVLPRLTAQSRLRIQQRAAPAHGPVVEMVNGELRPAHYKIIADESIVRLAGNTDRPLVRIVYGPGFQPEGSADWSELPVKDVHDEPLAATNPYLCRLISDGVVELHRVPERAPYHVGIINGRDVYVEERHQHGSPRGAWLLCDVHDLAARWRDYVRDIAQFAEDERAAARPSQVTSRESRLTGMRSQPIAWLVAVLCLVGVIVALTALHGTITGFVLFFGSVLLACEDILLFHNAGGIRE